MSVSVENLAFGPVPSRRLGRSLGINNIPPKICTYSCVYCQVGRTLNMQHERKSFYNSEEIFQAADDKIRKAREKGEPVDYLTFVPDGEPSLDVNLGREIERLKPLGIKIAVITNASLIGNNKVQEDLNKADWVSVKIDAVTPDAWRRVNRPHGSLNLNEILHGISEFADLYGGDLMTETMLVNGINDSTRELERVSDFIAGLKSRKSYIAIPIRPPAEKFADVPAEAIVNRTYQIFEEKGIPTEYLIGYEGDAFAFTGNIEEDLLSITAVHPMREDAVEKMLIKSRSGWDTVENLIEEDKLVEVDYKEQKFYVRKLR